jgi:hypothetical protein
MPTVIHTPAKLTDLKRGDFFIAGVPEDGLLEHVIEEEGNVLSLLGAPVFLVINTKWSESEKGFSGVHVITVKK